MGLLEEVGSPFMLEGHSHWAPSSVWRKELPSCLLWQNLPEDSDTIAHPAPCFLSFFSILLKFPTLTARLCPPSLLTCVKWDSIDQGHCLLNWPSEGPWTMWGHRHRYPVTPTDSHEAQGPTCTNSTPRWQLLEGRWTGERESTAPLRHAPWMQRSGWWARVPKRVADPRGCEVPSWPPLGPTSQSPAPLSAQEPWEDQGSTKRSMGSSLQGLAGGCQQYSVGEDLEGGPTAHSRAPHSRHSSDDICEPSFSASPSCLPFLPHAGALEGMARKKEHLKSLDSQQHEPWIVKIPDLL